MGPVALSACATSAVVKPELAELQAEVRALRSDNVRLETRLEKLERNRAVTVTPAGPSPAAETAPPTTAHAMPDLTVVKLKPKKEAAPKVSTAVPVLEPEPEVISSLEQVLPGPAAAYENDAERGDAAFNKGVSALKTGNVEGGIAQLQQFAAEAPKHAKADNALYFTGLGYMGLNDLEDAAGAFEAVAKKYPAGDAVVDALLKLAECRTKMNQPVDARKAYQRIVKDWPDTPAAQAAKSRLSLLPNASVSP